MSSLKIDRLTFSVSKVGHYRIFHFQIPHWLLIMEKIGDTSSRAVISYLSHKVGGAFNQHPGIS